MKVIHKFCLIIFSGLKIEILLALGEDITSTSQMFQEIHSNLMPEMMKSWMKPFFLRTTPNCCHVNSHPSESQFMGLLEL